MTHMTQGIVVFEIIINANKVILNGIYANDGDRKPHDQSYEVNNQIAKKKPDSVTSDPNDILVGEYDLRYIDSNLVNGILTIKIVNEAYVIDWYIFVKRERFHQFTGIGLKAGERHLAVSYLNLQHLAKSNTTNN